VEAVFFRGLIGAVCILGWSIRNPSRLLGNRHGLLLARSLSGTVALALAFFAFGRMPLANAMLLNQATPIFMLPMAALLLKERVTRNQVLLVLLAFAGVVMVIRPDSGGVNPAALLALGSAFFAAIAYILVRYLSSSDEPLVVVFWFSAVSALVMIPLMLPVFVMPSAASWASIIAMSLLGLAGQIALTRGYHLAEAGRLAVIGSTGAVFGALWDFIWWHHLPDEMTIAGGVVVISCCAAVQIQRNQLKTTDGH
jgi:drug/metabolite transporter (DMT)-like permease